MSTVRRRSGDRIVSSLSTVLSQGWDGASTRNGYAMHLSDWFAPSFRGFTKQLYKCQGATPEKWLAL